MAISIRKVSLQLVLNASKKSLRPRQNWPSFSRGDIYKWIVVNKYTWITIKMSLKFVPIGSINNIPALVQIMAWCRPADKRLSEPMMFSLLTHICITRPQHVMYPFSILLAWWRCVCKDGGHQNQLWEKMMTHALNSDIHDVHSLLQWHNMQCKQWRYNVIGYCLQQLVLHVKKYRMFVFCLH